MLDDGRLKLTAGAFKRLKPVQQFWSQSPVYAELAVSSPSVAETVVFSA